MDKSDIRIQDTGAEIMNFIKKYAPIFAAAALILILSLILAGTYLLKQLTPSEERADLNEYFGLIEEWDVAILYEGVLVENDARYMDGHLYLSYSFVHDYINERFYWDSNENLLLYTTTTDVIKTEPQTADYYIGTKKQTGDFGEIVKLDGDLVFVNIEYVDAYSDLKYEFYSEPNRLVMEVSERYYQQAEVKTDTEIRTLGGIKNPILTTVTKGMQVEILLWDNKWTMVRSEDGYVGYIKTSCLSKETEGKVELELTVEEFQHQFAEGTICMGWHQVNRTSDNNKISELLSESKGLNVVSPTWFYLNDNQGGIASLASKDYVDYCHSQGVEVWGLVSNLTNKSVDSTIVLTNTSYRENLVNNIIAKAIEYELDGINLDLEALDHAVGDGYIQLIRELSLKCHANRLTLSVDNYVPTAYTAFYNRSQQALFADYIIIMAYDEHYVGSDPGSVSSIGFVTQGIEGTLEEVPANQIVLGLPFYCRLWEETPEYNEEGDLVSVSVSSTAYGFNGAERAVTNGGAEPVWDDTVGQYYAEFIKDGKTYRIWMEEERSLELKLQKMKEYGLAGVSFWKLGLEREETWNTVIKYLGN